MERGELRVYLGAAPGVGKTFAMLQEGRRRAERGTDVVIGFVETHGRSRTVEAIGDLEVVPRRVVRYRGLQTEEMDLRGLLARGPAVALVDELAHTNIDDGSDQHRHGKRWQDVQELLAAGIDVITTVNIQHLESLNDVVTSITGIRQNETVPDRVVRSAETVELVDMSPQSLRRRMVHGNIYTADRIDTALSHYFREGNLAALRELALLWLADRVDEGMDRYRGEHKIDSTWATRERVVVGVSGGPESQTLMRRAARIATRTTGGEWIAVYVSRSDGLTGATPDQLERMRAAANEMGGTFHAVVAGEPADGLLDFARGVNATQVLVGASRRSRWSTLIQPGIGEVVIAQSGDIDVHVVTHDQARRGARRRNRSALSVRRVVAGYLMAVLGTTLVSLALFLTIDLHGLTTEVLIMIALVVATALVGGVWPAVVSAVLGSISLNVLFIPPTGTLTIADPENAIALLIFVLTGVAVASVVNLAARRTQEAIRARAEANALAVLSHRLLHAGDDPVALLRQACEVFGMVGAAILRTTSDGPPTVAAFGEVILDGEPDASADIAPGYRLGLYGRSLEATDRTLLTAYAAHLGVLQERRVAEATARETRELAEGNRTRTALLAAVSHDLRSPLAAIKAAISSLRNDAIAWSEEDERDLQATIEESADRLDALVANLLDMSRLQTRSIHPLNAELDLGDAIARALATVPGSTPVTVTLPPDLPLAVADPGLLERVIANVVENAIKHTPSDTPVQLLGSTWSDPETRLWVSLRIVDHGAGVPDHALETIFEPFQRLGDVPRGDGVGLGLAVARGLVESMGGTLTADHTPGSGLTMVLDLPTAPQDPTGSASRPDARPDAEPDPRPDARPESAEEVAR